MDDASVTVPRARTRVAGVLKRFDNLSRNPLGGHFKGGSPSSESMSQIYAAAVDLSTPLFEATYRALQRAGFRVWKNYHAHEGTPVGPPGETRYLVVQGTLEHLEISTFERDEQIDEAARVSLPIRLSGPNGELVKKEKLELVLRIQRDKRSDLMVALGDRLAARIATHVNQGASR